MLPLSCLVRFVHLVPGASRTVWNNSSQVKSKEPSGVTMRLWHPMYEVWSTGVLARCRFCTKSGWFMLVFALCFGCFTCQALAICKAKVQQLNHDLSVNERVIAPIFCLTNSLSVTGISLPSYAKICNYATMNTLKHSSR